MHKVMTMAVAAILTTIASVHTALAVPSLAIGSDGNLQILETNGNLKASLQSGTVSEAMVVDNQAMKISYGSDLSDRTVLIVYPDPERPQTLTLNILGQPTVISPDAVLTVTSMGDGSNAYFQAGVLGTVTVGGTQLKDNQTLQVNKGQRAMVSATPSAVAPSAPLTQTPSMPSGQQPGTSSKGTSPLDLGPFTAAQLRPENLQGDQYTGADTAQGFDSDPRGADGSARYLGPVVRKVEGDVMRAPKGQDIVDLLKSAPTPPRLNEGDRIKEGDTIQTGPNGSAIINPWPGGIMLIEPNTTVIVKNANYTEGMGEPSHIFDVDVKEGSVLNVVKNLHPTQVDYKVRTPHGVAAARGCVWHVIVNIISNTTVVVSAEGDVIVTHRSASYKATLNENGKIVLTPTGGSSGPASEQDLNLIGRLLQLILQFILDFGDILPNIAGFLSDTEIMQQINEIYDGLKNLKLDPTTPIKSTENP
jgi:hypothetical protein